jgi:hypothetical protein
VLVLAEVVVVVAGGEERDGGGDEDDADVNGTAPLPSSASERKLGTNPTTATSTDTTATAKPRTATFSVIPSCFQRLLTRLMRGSFIDAPEIPILRRPAAPRAVCG